MKARWMSSSRLGSQTHVILDSEDRRSKQKSINDLRVRKYSSPQNSSVKAFRTVTGGEVRREELVIIGR